ncbi:hypothetical protein GOP47_0011742 [Adiantum capillus-veneris]|uniref:Uncharacterized protein n=1 Tax=Adiantum capillus-veneris TaxID=13818 RepID=A0A9D4UTC0_ADICA|nr:hypothetical protein GOP47_0011742 [Adiantum capillus-veneris]
MLSFGKIMGLSRKGLQQVREGEDISGEDHGSTANMANLKPATMSMVLIASSTMSMVVATTSNEIVDIIGAEGLEKMV